MYFEKPVDLFVAFTSVILSKMGGDEYKSRAKQQRSGKRRKFHSNAHTLKKNSSILSGSEDQCDPPVKQHESATSSKLHPAAFSEVDFGEKDFNFFMNFDCLKLILETIGKCRLCSGDTASNCDVSIRFGLNLTIDISCVNESCCWVQSFQKSKGLTWNDVSEPLRNQGSHTLSTTVDEEERVCPTLSL